MKAIDLCYMWLRKESDTLRLTLVNEEGVAFPSVLSLLEHLAFMLAKKELA